MISVLRQIRGVWRLDLSVVRLQTALIPFAAQARPWVVLSGLVYNTWHDPRRERSLPDLARGVGVACHEHLDRGDVLAIHRGDLGRIVTAAEHLVEFHCWDAASPPPRAVLAQQAQVIANRGHWRERRAALNLLAGARVFVACYDNANTVVEARDPALPRDVFSAALREEVGLAVRAATHRSAPPVADVPERIVADLWAELRAGNYRVVGVKADGEGVTRVRIGYAPLAVGRDGPVALGPFEPAGHLDYSLRTAGWAMRRH